MMLPLKLIEYLSFALDTVANALVKNCLYSLFTVPFGGFQLQTFFFIGTGITE